ncbi:conserved hypothetical protein [Talaromyces stipitatus ATCC 10500]|uniref:Nascent polypeptide-associated complex subunit alpha-like UBA domain-containing protein n=1 Tax=Talaromyces stipitatus (strain ATCC 10500 / CBS 375.48 / QM 6759 / NRRL 1006) TaxID=441959 RepID=B8MHZ0_TALSN|nr:uncharacterized protein TSTA_015580 [Talaromyces stipitatus ATCC 10500]EED16470.1 conserved hypothetical protein [Talaromyces stipitatus ATCC 10500]
MADRIPSAAEGEDQRLPVNAEDRKAAAALSSLNDNEISQDGDAAGSNSKLSSAAAQEALGKAMSRLEIASGGASGKTTGGGAGTNKTVATETAKKKAVKIVAEDVTLLVEELDLTKNKATELLRSHDGDAKEAIRAFLTPTIAA